MALNEATSEKADIKTNTAFFEYEQHAESDLANFNKFKTMNEQTLEELKENPATAPREKIKNNYFGTGDFIESDHQSKLPKIWTELTFAEPSN